MHYAYLAIAIVTEVMATSALKASDGLSRPWPTLVMAAGYATSLACLGLSLRDIPIGIAYAIWSGAGIVLIAAIGWVWFRQALDWPAIAGMTLIVAGVVVLNLSTARV
jgi:small multidrug resistance pump